MAITSYSGKNMKHGKGGKKNFVPRNKGNSDQRLRLNCDALSEKGRAAAFTLYHDGNNTLLQIKIPTEIMRVSDAKLELNVTLRMQVD
ncbi:hypothetical protein ZIOFF_010881 [Zingiber officinale]|uniref:Uncharacterized protein n=1 Tax=Zingiber officinale TaxID=94328 RepID=A0A8J5I268_ZINOF|nr:hypothetical protein ZIOFF_010881 [Zingiber officinale]